jgi:hypothetical protein
MECWNSLIPERISPFAACNRLAKRPRSETVEVETVKRRHFSAFARVASTRCTRFPAPPPRIGCKCECNSESSLENKFHGLLRPNREISECHPDDFSVHSLQCVIQLQEVGAAKC